MADPDNSVLENARKRARRRLVGAVVLALAAAVVLPMFLESDPKPLGPDVQIEIPAIDDARFQNRLTPPGTAKGAGADKVAQTPAEPPKAPAIETAKAPAIETAKALAVETAKAPAVETAKAPAVETAKAPAPVAVAAAPTANKPEPVPTVPVQAAAKKQPPPAATPSAAPPSVAAAPAPAVVPAPAGKSAAAAPTERVAAQTSAPAAALPAFSLTATVPPAGAAPAAAPAAAPPVAPGQFVVQLGAFLDSSVARDLAGKAGQQGFPAFLEAVTTKSGQVQRVRVGPFATRGEADAAAARLKGAGLTADVRPR